MRTLRCSSLPLIFQCAHSAILPEQPSDDPVGAPAELGTRVHAQADRIVAGLPPNDVESEDERFLVSAVEWFWKANCKDYPEPLTEALLTSEGSELDDYELLLTGHSDVLSAVGDCIRVLDWKTGYKDTDYAEQMLGYCACLLLKFPHMRYAEATIVWLRTKQLEIYSMDRQQLGDWIVLLSNHIRSSPINYGGHCAYCPRNHECNKMALGVRRDIDCITNQDLVSWGQLNSDDTIALRVRAKMIRDMCQRLMDSIKDRAITVGGINGTKMSLITRNETRRHLKPLLAWPILESRGFTDEDFAQCVKISLSDASDVVASKTPRGHKKSAIVQFVAELEAVDAVATTDITKLVEVRNQNV